MNEHKYATIGKIGPYARSRDSWNQLVKWIAKNGMHRLEDIRYANKTRLQGKLTQKLNRNELLELWIAVDRFRASQK